VFVVVCAFLVVVPVYVAPYEVAMGLLITLIGIPFYYIGVVWQNKPKWVQHAIGAYTKSVVSDLGNRLDFNVINLYFHFHV